MRRPSRWGAAPLLLGIVELLLPGCSDAQVITCEAERYGACSCTADDAAVGNDVQCKPAGDAVCCAADAWPEDSTSCKCSGTWTCQASGASCACQLGPPVYEGVAESATCAPEPNAVCCQFWDTCSCGNGECDEGHTQVADCAFATVVDLLEAYQCGAKGGPRPVESCIVAQ